MCITEPLNFFLKNISRSCCIWQLPKIRIFFIDVASILGAPYNRQSLMTRYRLLPRSIHVRRYVRSLESNTR
jgi:hypothetical protein